MEKTLQELYDEVVKDSNLIKEFTEAEKEGKLEDFAKVHGCSAIEEEIKKFIESKLPNVKELSPDELDQVAGGKDARFLEIKCDKCGETKTHNENAFGYYYEKMHKEYDPNSTCDGILRRGNYV